jgi:hypothetical protein
MTRKYYLGRYVGTTAEPSEVLADAEVLDDVGVLPKDQSRIAARIDSETGIALTRLAENRPWEVWHIDLQTAYGSQLEAALAAGYKKAPMWSAFLWPA